MRPVTCSLTFLPPEVLPTKVLFFFLLSGVLRQFLSPSPTRVDYVANVGGPSLLLETVQKILCILRFKGVDGGGLVFVKHRITFRVDQRYLY